MNLSEYKDERWEKDRKTDTHTHRGRQRWRGVGRGERKNELLLFFLFGFVRMFTNQKRDAWLNFGCFSMSNQ